MAERYSPQRVVKNAADTIQAFARFGQKFPIVAHQFLEQIDEGRLNIGVEYPDAVKMEEQRTRRNNRLILALSAATLLGAGVAMRNDVVEPIILGWPWPTTLCVFPQALWV